MRAMNALFLAILLTLSSGAWAQYSADGPSPSTDLGPSDVVQIVVDALKTNNSDAGDQGIATVWRFAAPGNKAVTGPLPRFTTMLKGSFGEMLNHVDNDYGRLEIRGEVAMQPVWLLTPQGTEVAYMFRLRRQSADTGKFEGMWMTEAVFPIPPRKNGDAI